MTMEKIRIAIIDDHSLFREGIRVVLSQVEGFEVVFETDDGNRFVEFLRDNPANVALMDIEMPLIGGALTTEKALKVQGGLKVVALTMFSDTGNYIRMIQAGVKGFVLKKANKFELEQAIRTVHQGGNYFSQEILQKMAFRSLDQASGNDQISTREIEIISLVCQGLTSQEISEKLFISVKTIETHRSNIFQKAGVKNVAGLIMWALKNQYHTLS